MMKDSTSHTTAVLAQPEDESSFRESALAAWGWTAAPVLFLVLVLALLFGRHDTYLRSAQVPAVTESVQPQQPLPDIRVLRRKGTQIVVAVPANTPDSDLSRVVESIRDKIKSSHPSDLQLGSTYPGVSASSGTILVFRTDGVRVPPLAKSDAVIRWKGTESAATLRDTIGTRSELAASRERLTKVRSAQTNDSNENQTASDSKERLNGNSEPSSLRFSSADADHYAGGIQNSARVNGNLEVLSDTAGVDFEAYLSRVLQSIRMNWYNLIPEEARAPVFKEGNVSIEFVIMPDGKIAGMKVVGPSGDVELDRAAWGGITASAPFAPLPTEFHGPYLALRFRFRYNSQHDNSK
jgi:TonB family protein